jgi:sigma-B regulation protein RsbU (phosphoserine phosphatase)
VTARETLGAIDVDSAFALLADMSQGFAEAQDVETTLERALASIAELVGAEAGSLWLVDEPQHESVCQACVGPNPITGMRLPVSEGIIGKSVRENVCQSVLDVAQDPNFSGKMDRASGFVTRSLLCAPMRSGNRVIGAVELINKKTGNGCFAEHDALLLQVLASSAGLAITNQRLVAAQVESERVRRELELAAEIQRSLLPPARPAPFPIYGINVPARTVSGDFFDILELSEGRLAFCLGDVSGKGMNAAILMSKTASLYRCLAREGGGPGALLARLNDEVCETATRGMFVTMAAGSFDARTGRVRLANAGHEPALVHVSGGRFESLEAEAPPLGILPETDFPEREVELRGGALYLCSDGLTEAEVKPGRPLGRAGLAGLIERFAGKPLAERIEAIAAEVGRLDLRDDLTLLGVSHEAGR